MKFMSLLRRAINRHTSKRPKAGPADGWVTTAIHIRRDQWNLIRAEALAMQHANGGRSSASALIRDIIDAHFR